MAPDKQGGYVVTILMSIFLGLVQGIAEFLPISSSGHLSILQNLLSLDYQSEQHLLFGMLLNLATLISICVVYRKELGAMLSSGKDYLRDRSDGEADEPAILKPQARTLLFILIGTLPMFLVLIFSSSIVRLFYNTAFVGFALLITGGLLFVSDKYITRGSKTERTIQLSDAVIVGLVQAVAALPGLSRSGTTIAVGLARGFSGSFAVRFSILLSVPALLGATIVLLVRVIINGADFSLLPMYLAGFIIATVVGFFAIQILRRIVSKGGFGKIAFYCWGLGALAILLTLIL